MLWVYGYLHNRVAIAQSQALTVGTGFHAVSATMLKEEPWPDLSGLDPYDVARVQALAVFWQTRKAYDGMRILAVEQRFEKVLDGVPLHGDLDTLVELPDKRIAVIDRKTTGADIGPGSNYREGLLLNSQVAHYCYLAGAELAIWDVVRKPGLRPHQNESPEAFGNRWFKAMMAEPEKHHQMIVVEPQQWQMDAWRSDILDVARLSETGMYPRNTAACFDYNHPCDYWPVCTQRADLDDDTLYRIRDKDGK